MYDGGVTGSAEGAVGRILRNARALLSGKAVGAILSIAYMGIAARTLGPEGMGTLFLVHAYAMTAAGIARFQSWQAIIRFGVPMLADSDDAGLRTLFRFTIRVDVISSILAAIVAAAIAPFIAQLLGWSNSVLNLVFAYCIAIPFLIAATPTGVLRLFDRFKTLGWQLTITPVTRFVGALILWVAGAGLEAFIALWLLSVLLHGISLWVLGWRELIKQKLTPKLLSKAEKKRDRRWWPFIIKTNLSSTIELSNDHVPLLIVGAILGPSAAGFLKVAVNLANILAQATSMLNNAIYPELSKIEAKEGRAAMLRTCFKSIGAGVALASPFVIFCFPFGYLLILLVAGEQFLPAAALLGWLALAQLFRIIWLGLESAALARGRAGRTLIAKAVSGVAHLGSLPFLLTLMGVIAAPTALIASWIILIVILFVSVLQPSKKELAASQ